MYGKLDAGSYFLKIIGIVLTFCVICCAQGIQYNARCETGLTPQNRTFDNCDKSKYLLCRHSRCECLDPENQVWTFEPTGTSPHTLLRFKRSSSPLNDLRSNSNSRQRSRVKRSRRGGFRPGPKGSAGGGGVGRVGGIAAGVAVGAAGGYLASNVINANVNNLGQSNQVPPLPESNPKYDQNRRYSCYTRTGGQCRIDSPFQNVQIARIAKCVPYAKCVHKTDSNNQIQGDSRFGICACKLGYSATEQDYCVAGAPTLKSSTLGLIFIFMVSNVVFMFSNNIYTDFL